MVYFEMALKWFGVLFPRKIKIQPTGYWFSQWELVLFIWYNQVRILA